MSNYPDNAHLSAPGGPHERGPTLQEQANATHGPAMVAAAEIEALVAEACGSEVTAGWELARAEAVSTAVIEIAAALWAGDSTTADASTVVPLGAAANGISVMTHDDCVTMSTTIVGRAKPTALSMTAHLSATDAIALGLALIRHAARLRVG